VSNIEQTHEFYNGINKYDDIYGVPALRQVHNVIEALCAFHRLECLCESFL
jgi:hypothetical protein